MISPTEENYLKAIFMLSEKQDKETVSTNAIAKQMKTSAASVTDMLKRLTKKSLINYKRYKGVSLTQQGHLKTMALVRNHRLWEVFLVQKLNFSWDEVHEVAEQLEHVKSDQLIERLDNYLGQPKFDPHGDPIPDSDGNIIFRQQVALTNLPVGAKGVVVGVQEDSKAFLQYLDQMNLTLGTAIEVLKKFEYDESILIRMGGEKEQILSNKICQNLFIQKKQ